MISKELAKAVLSGEYKKAFSSDKEVLCITMNIHELAHLCKEWALTKGYTVQTGLIGIKVKLTTVLVKCIGTQI